MRATERVAPSLPAAAWVLVYAPLRSDNTYLCEFLRAHEVASRAAKSADELAALLAAEPRILVISQEALSSAAVDVLSAHLTRESYWSDIPVIVLAGSDANTLAALRDLEQEHPHWALRILHRPVRSNELITAVRASLAARARQLELRDHVEMQQELQRELVHRVKNVLANVTAIYHMSLRQSATLEEFDQRFSGRMVALDKVHSSLVGAQRAQSRLRDLIASILAPYQDDGLQRTSLRGDNTEVNAAAATTLGLMFHELATNASKYGALSVPEGSVSVEWKRSPGDGEQLLHIVWQETGGPGIEAPARSGYGTSFIQSAARSTLRGSVDIEWRSQGIVCAIRAPLTSLAA